MTKSKINKFIENYEKAILEGHKETMINMSKQSLKECPVDTGAMRESYNVDLNGKDFIKGSKNGTPKIINDTKKVNNDFVKSEASYSTEYVIYQHEDLTLNHPVPGTKAKFLEDPAKVARKEYMKNIKEKIKEVMR